MRRTLFLLAVCVSQAVILSCGPALPALVARSEGPKPRENCPIPRTEGNRRIYCAWGPEKPTEHEAKQAAVATALVEAAGEIGIRVESNFEVREACHNDECSITIDSYVGNRVVPTTFAGVQKHNIWFECTLHQGVTACTANAVISISTAEIKWNQRVMKGRALLVLDCPPKHDYSCSQLVETTRKSLSGVGISLVEETLDQMTDVQHLGETYDARFVIKVNLSVRSLGMGGDDAWYAEGSANAELYETHHGKSLWVEKTPSRKQGSYKSADDAIDRAINDVASRLATRIGTLCLEELGE